MQEQRPRTKKGQSMDLKNEDELRAMSDADLWHEYERCYEFRGACIQEQQKPGGIVDFLQSVTTQTLPLLSELRACEGLIERLLHERADIKR